MPSFALNTATRRATTLAGLALTCLIGCAPVATDRVTVELRSGSDQRPVENALITVKGLNPVHPFRVDDYLRAKPGDYPSVQTNAAGRAVVTVPTDRPFQMTIILPGLIPGSIFFNSGLNGTALPTPWQRLEVGAGRDETTRITELRFTPAP